ncbi:PEP-CTERM sorting domain-containing protein [Luteolibacter luteus]|uniref:PEP-CTERM sorting domain-containing protein n=1 Tax=Luteolibacter luteus TaxID=2728835 RepID=A0A858RG59_9BACT|nr:PEP-CTERM sorting domain-containing protein [Luteolibacter luteus]QJE95123.1 PEP-CTERM sorting domain-containing protein [Luteolibacter luteus]
MKNPLVSSLIAYGFLTLASQAALIATENFDYVDGSVAGQTGGTGWNYERNDEAGAPAQSPSTWNSAFGSHQIVSSTLVTNGGGVLREFGGSTEGIGATNEQEGAFRASGVMFFSTSITVAEMLPEGQNQWAGVSSFDFGEERIFFGMPGQTGTTRFFGIAAPGFGADTIGSIPVVAGTTYTIVGMLDFDNDQLGLWVNPDGDDTAATFDVSKAYNGGNWSTSLRWASGTSVAWDNVRVGTTFGDVVPEPSTPLLALGAAGVFFLIRRRH